MARRAAGPQIVGRRLEKEKVSRVERSLDDGERKRPGEVVVPKAAAGRRRVPALEPLKRELAAHKLRTGRSGDDLVFGTTATCPFTPSTVSRRALSVWKGADPEPIALSRGAAYGGFDDDRLGR